jgi:hypothetical protein
LPRPPIAKLSGDGSLRAAKTRAACSGAMPWRERELYHLRAVRSARTEFSQRENFHHSVESLENFFVSIYVIIG